MTIHSDIQPHKKNIPSLVIIDDEEAILRSLRSLLRRDGYNMNFFTSGYEALKFLEQNEVDVILSDMRMPEMNGTELLAKSINAKTIIETGTFRGFSSANLAIENPDAEIYTFEYDGRNAAEAKVLFRKMKFRNVHLIEGDVLVELPKQVRKLKKVDLLFVDDSKKNYRKNFEAVLPKLRVGGIAAAHDTSQDVCGETHTRKFKEYLQKRKDFRVIEVDKEDRGLTIAQRIK